METVNQPYILFWAITGGNLIFLVTVLAIIISRSYTPDSHKFYKNAIISSIVYQVGLILIYFLKDIMFLAFFLTAIVFSLKFYLEARMFKGLKYTSTDFMNYFIGLTLLTFSIPILYFTGINEKLVYFSIIVFLNLVMCIVWILKAKIKIMGISHILSITLFASFFDNYQEAIFYSLIPYGLGVIYILSKDYLDSVKFSRIINQDKDKVIESLNTQFLEFLGLLINTIESRYERRKNHSRNVTMIAEGIAREMGIGEKFEKFTRESSIIHDIGYIGIDHRIFSKKEDLTDEEVEKIKPHTIIGKSVLEKSVLFIKYIPAVLYHHEKIDGTGYPEGLKGNALPLISKILCVANEFENLINGRYSKPLIVKDAVDYIVSKSGILFDPLVVEAFKRFVRKTYY